MSKQAEKMARDIAQLDFENGDIFCFKFGGDGDNGEHLIYLLDKHFKSEPSVPVSELQEIYDSLWGSGLQVRERIGALIDKTKGE
jgi:hypothetical protein